MTTDTRPPLCLTDRLVEWLDAQPEVDRTFWDLTHRLIVKLEGYDLVIQFVDEDNL